MSAHGAAGRQGDDVRSDLFVEFASTTSGGRQIAVTSKVEAFYGAAIREMAEAVLTGIRVEHAQVAIDDKGALPFVIAARVEAAARRAGVEGGDARPDRSTPDRSPSAKTRPRRSRLYLPGNEPKFMVNAGLHRPDAVILDLEDSVHPAEKDAARLLVRNALRVLEFGQAERMVRINQLPLGMDDLQAVVPELPDVILIPKVEDPEHVRTVDERVRKLLDTHEVEWTVWLMPILESALGIERAFDIATATESVAAVTIGLEDYTADMGVVKTADGDESLYARRRLVNAAHAARVQAIDSVFGDVGDVEGLTSWAARSRAMGFEGMGCIHPRQIEPIHRAFQPSAPEIEKARQIVAAFEEAQAKGLGVVSLGSRMIDPPVVLRAQRVVADARQMGLIPEEDDDGAAS
ncbi:MAG: aldolase/citrate lyase family protein [Gemmatimonadales bacterium]|jgi:citrate lyase subunit beta/citryl-CoA lyase